MKLRDMRLCVQCDEVFEPQIQTDINGENIRRDFSCPSCGCTATFPVCQWLPTMNTAGANSHSSLRRRNYANR